MNLRQLLAASAVSLGIVGSVCGASAVAATARGSALPSAATNLQKNSGFEKPVLPSDSYQVYSAGQKYTGWTVVGPSGSNINPVTGDYTDEGYAFDGRQGPGVVPQSHVTGRFGGASARFTHVEWGKSFNSGSAERSAPASRRGP